MKKIIKLEKAGCVPCQMVQNFLDSNEVEVEKVDVFDSPEIAAKYNISSVPVTILLDEEGNEITRSIGYKVPELEDLIETYLQK